MKRWRLLAALCWVPLAHAQVLSTGVMPSSSETLTVLPNGDLGLKRGDGTLFDSGVVVPTPASTTPPANTPAGIAGVARTYTPSDATAPSLTRSARATTASDGSFSVTWQVPLASANPVAPNPAPINVGNQAILCNYTSVTAVGLAGKCWTIQNTALTLSAITSGVTISPAVNSAAGIQLSLFAREPTQ